MNLETRSAYRGTDKRGSGVAHQLASPSCIDEFRSQGHTILPSLFSRDTMAEIGDIVSAVQNAAGIDEAVHGQPERAFWKRSAALEAFILSPLLGQIGAELLGTNGTRLIHDALFVKVGSVNGTDWHRDSDFWLFSGRGAVTFWIPLQDTPRDMALRYVPKSHTKRRRLLRKYEKAMAQYLNPVSQQAMKLGDVAVHHYDTLHSSTRYRFGGVRKALAIHLLDADARMVEPQTELQATHNIRCEWNQLKPGALFPDRLAPLLYYRGQPTLSLVKGATPPL